MLSVRLARLRAGQIFFHAPSSPSSPLTPRICARMSCAPRAPSRVPHARATPLRVPKFAPHRLVGFFAQKNDRVPKRLPGIPLRGVEKGRAAWAFLTSRRKKMARHNLAAQPPRYKKNQCADSTCCRPNAADAEETDAGCCKAARKRSVAKFIAALRGVCIFLTVSRVSESPQ
jgi:hypothetical protein